MSISNSASYLGQRGGLARARRLSPERKKEIAAMGARARLDSLDLAKKIQENFRYLEAVQTLSPPPRVRSVKRVVRRLPGVYL